MNEEIRFYRASGKYGFLSNLYNKEITFEEQIFRNSEEAYQYGKPKDRATAEWIISAPKPHLCAIAAHSLLVFDITPNWNKTKVDRMYRVLKAKFTHEELKSMLLNTGNATLIEDSKADAFWGVGKKGTGKNMLGKLLMQVREEIREEERMGILPDLI